MPSLSPGTAGAKEVYGISVICSKRAKGKK